MSERYDPKHMRYPETPADLPGADAAPRYGSDVIADALASLGLRHVFLVPGSSFRGLHDSLVNHTRNRAPQIVLCTTETIAVSMAHGYAKATGEPSLCIVHDLVGLMLGSMAVYNAYCDRTPVMILGGCGPADPARRRYIDWVHSARSQSDLVRPFSKWTSEPPTLQATLDALFKARKVAASQPRGPVYVSIDQGVQEAAIPGDLVIPSPDLPHNRVAAPAAPNPRALAAAADLLLGAELPLIVAGRFGIRAEVTAHVQRLVELTGAAYVDDRAIVCMPSDHPQNLSGDPEIRTRADVVLALDCIDATNAVGGYGGAERGREGQRLINVSMENVVPDSWSNFGAWEAAVDLQLDCDPLLASELLGEAIGQRLAGDERAAQRVAARKRHLAGRHAKLRRTQRERWFADRDRVPIRIERLVHELHEVVRGRPWFLPVRNHRSFPEGIWQFEGAGQYLGADGGGGVGYGPGGAVGAALARKGEGLVTVALMGDGDFVMSAGAVWTAAHYRVALLIVIVNNTSWGNDEQHQVNVARSRNRPIGNAWIGQRMVDPEIDFATLARGFGAWSAGPVTEPGDLAGVFAQAVAQVEAGRVAVVDVRI